MTPEQKAKELVEKFGNKHCALICVIEQLEEHSCHTLNDERWDFWQQVQEEIKKL